MKIFIFFLILSVLSSLSFPSQATEWQDICTVTIHNNQSITCSNYNITSPQFNAPEKAHKDSKGKLILDNPVIGAVLFTVSGKDIKEILFLSGSESFTNTDDTVKITLSSMTAPTSLSWEYSQYNPSAALTISHRAEPVITVSVIPEKANYDYSQDLITDWHINVSNPTTSEIKDITIKYLDSEYTIQSLPGTPKGKKIFPDSRDFQVKTNENYTVNATATFKALIGKTELQYTFNASGTINVHPAPHNVLFTKYIKDRIYTENNSIVLSIANSGMYQLTNVIVTDQFKDTGIIREWRFDSIPPYTSQNIQYKVNPAVPGHFISPMASLTYEIDGISFSMASNQVAFDIIDTGKGLKSPSSDEINVIVEATIIQPEIVPTDATVTPERINRTTHDVKPTMIVVTPIPARAIVIVPPVPDPTEEKEKGIPGFEGMVVIMILLVMRKR